MRQERNCIQVNGAASLASSDKPLHSSASCFACGDPTHDNIGGQVLCDFCLMILDNSSHWGRFLTAKGEYSQPTIMEDNQATIMEDNQLTILEDSTTSTEADCSIPISDSKPTGQPKFKKSLCEVCGASASGLHFGVFTCEGCKCFYRRTIKEGATYVCIKSNDCSITMETRNSCRYCRFQKCMSLGMCKEGIKLGRRPKVDSEFRYSDNLRKERHEFQNTMNVQRWHSWPTVCTPSNHQHAIKQEAVYPAQMQNCSSYSSPYPTKQEPFSYCKQKTTLDPLQNDAILDPSFNNNFNTDIFLGNHAMQQSYSTGYQNTSQVSYLSNAYHHNPTHQPITPSLSMTLPEVHTGAFTAMAYANMYRGQNMNDSSGDEIQTEDSEEVKLTELKPLRKRNHIASETPVVSSVPMSYETWEQYKQNQTDNNLKRKKSIHNDNNNNTKILRMNGSSENFVKVYENLEKLVVEEWTSSLKSSGNMSEVLNPPKSSMPKVKACFKKFAESITGFKDLTKESKDRFVKRALCPVLGIIITHYFMNKTGDNDPVVPQQPAGCKEDIQRLSNQEMAVLCGICLTQKDKTQKLEDSREVDMIKMMEQSLQTSLEDMFEVDRYLELLDIASKVCQTSTESKDSKT